MFVIVLFNTKVQKTLNNRMV